MATKAEIPQAAGVSPTDKKRPGMGKQRLSDASDSHVPSMPPDDACDEPAPEAPGGAGKGAIAKDGKTGGDYDKVYGVRPKTTWQLKSHKERTLWEFIAGLDICPESAYQKRDASAPMRGPPPVRPIYEENFFILTQASLPLLIHTGWNYLLPEHKMHYAPAWMMYHLGFMIFAMTMLNRLHRYMAQYGSFDEMNRGRDMVDDRHVNHLGRSIFIYTIFRTLGPFLLAWRGDMTNPLEGLSWATPLKLAWWEIALDYWFYLYHRSCHEFDFLWFIHRQHHATKHPTPILSILADDYQEVLEIFLIPLLATAISPQMNFAELELVIYYTLYVEALGHSGIRAIWQHPILGYPLRILGMELAVEDHDLHHRFGKSGKNYGKQTRVWDKLFGTIGERIETPFTGPFSQK
jgi:sterol desaturase/sphingolipid hydroxylase (fatty acid hydroxylase superfamily)